MNEGSAKVEHKPARPHERVRETALARRLDHKGQRQGFGDGQRDRRQGEGRGVYAEGDTAVGFEDGEKSSQRLARGLAAMAAGPNQYGSRRRVLANPKHALTII